MKKFSKTMSLLLTLAMTASATTAFAGVSPIEKTLTPGLPDKNVTFKNTINASLDTSFDGGNGWGKPVLNMANSKTERVFKIAADDAVTAALPDGQGAIDSSKSFVLVDEHTMDNGKKEYFIVAMNGYGAQKVYDEKPTNTDYYTDKAVANNDPKHIQYKMNNPDATFTVTRGEETFTSHSLMSDEGWISGGDTGTATLPTGEDGQGRYTLPKQIRNYINTEHVWGMPTGTDASPRPGSFTAGITLLSWEECYAYRDIIGAVDSLYAGGFGNSYFLRNDLFGSDTPPNANYNTGLCLSNASNASWVINPVGSRIMRPCFYVTEDFFQNVKIDTSTWDSNVGAGRVVKAVISEHNTEESLKALGYTDAEANGIVGGLAPVTIGTYVTNDGIAVAGGRATSDENYVFGIEGSDQKFVMLDKNDNDEMFVITKGSYGSKPTTNVADYGGYFKDLTYTSDDYVYKWLNNDFLTAGNDGKKLPQGIIDNMVVSKWYHEPAGYSNIGYNRKFGAMGEGKVSYLSATEYKKYKNILGYADSEVESVLIGGFYGWSLRSQLDGANAGSAVARHDGSLRKTYNQNAPAVRPCFFLDEDFALNVKLDTEVLGDAVKAYITETYTRAEFANAPAGYSAEEVNAVYGLPVVVSGAAFKNAADETVTALVANSKIQTSFNVKNNGETPVSAIAIVAMFDKTTGALLNVSYTNPTVSVSEGLDSEVESGLLDIPADISNIIVRGYLWENFDTLKPLAEAMELGVN